MQEWIRVNDRLVCSLPHPHFTVEGAYTASAAIPPDDTNLGLHLSQGLQTNPGRRMTLHDYMNPPRLQRQPYLTLSDEPNNFRVDLGMLRLIPLFKDLPDENPYKYITEFEKVVNTIRREVDRKIVRKTSSSFPSKIEPKLSTTHIDPTLSLLGT